MRGRFGFAPANPYKSRTATRPGDRQQAVWKVKASTEPCHCVTINPLLRIPSPGPWPLHPASVHEPIRRNFSKR